jgi:hypothetical protein
MRYHWIMTWQSPPGVYRTQDGTVDLPPGMTRTEAFKWLFNQTAGRDGACVLFFSLEPDDMGGG